MEKLNFISNNEENYNSSFNITELKKIKCSPTQNGELTDKHFLNYTDY